MKKLLAIISLVAVFAIVLSSCCIIEGNCNEQFPTPHSAEYELVDAVNKVNEKAGTTKANLYFDNTKSMYGYICNNTTMRSNFTIVCQELANIIKGYNDFSINALVPNEAKVLEWESIGANGFSKFKQKDFYTFLNTSHDGHFDEANGQYGPLQILFDSSASPVNFDELNLFITDLAEQELNNKLLAEKINDIVLERDDHSVALYCIKSNFTGFASVPASGITDNGAVEMISNQNYIGERPFYCVIVGPTIEVVSLCNSLNETLTYSGLSENKDFYSAKVLSKRGLQYTPITAAESEVFGNLYVDEENKYHDYDQYQSGLNIHNSNLNFNVSALHYDQIFGDEVGELYGRYYQYDINVGSLDKTSFGNAAINFTIPLSDLADGLPAEHTRYIMTEDMVKVYGWTEKEVVTTDEYGDEEESTVWEWEEISHQDLFKSSEPYMIAPVCDFWNKGETIPRVSDYATNEDLKMDEYPKDKLDLYTVESKSGALRVRFEFENIDALAEKYSYITIVSNIDAKKELDTNVPQWIKDFNLSDSEEASPNNANLYQKTAGLLNFYKFLIGDMSSKSERDRFETHMTKNITDIVVTVKLED